MSTISSGPNAVTKVPRWGSWRTQALLHVECARTNAGTTLNVDRIDITAVQIQEKTETFG
jgi:hypothetical protein